jgi:hypothetical protein
MDERKKWWFVFNPHKQEVPTVRHESFAGAFAEAKRVCEQEKQKVHVLAVVGTWFPPAGPTWEERK